MYYRELNRGKYLQFDETPIKIQKQDKEAILAEYWDDSRYRKKKDDDGEDEENAESKARKNCYMWVVLGGVCLSHVLIVLSERPICSAICF